MLAGDGGAAGRRGAGEELRDVVVVEVDEDPAQREREEVRPQEAVGVHDGAPRRAETHRDAAGGGGGCPRARRRAAPPPCPRSPQLPSLPGRGDPSPLLLGIRRNKRHFTFILIRNIE